MDRKISRIVTLQVFSQLIMFFVSYIGAILVILLSTLAGLYLRARALKDSVALSAGVGPECFLQDKPLHGSPFQESPKSGILKEIVRKQNRGNFSYMSCKLSGFQS